MLRSFPLPAVTPMLCVYGSYTFHLLPLSDIHRYIHSSARLHCSALRLSPTMASADFSQFVVTTANETACETSPVKVLSLSLHVPAAFTRSSSNFWTSVPFATLSVFPSLICGSCPSGQRFAYSFFQIPSRGGHPCCSAMCFVVAYAHSGLTPVRECPCWANKLTRCAKLFFAQRVFTGISRNSLHEFTVISFFIFFPVCQDPQPSSPSLP